MGRRSAVPNRHRRRGDDDDDEGFVSAFMPPALCISFEKDADELPTDLKRRKRTELQGRIQQTGLIVAASESSDKKEAFFLVSAPDNVLRYEAERMELKCRLKEEHGGLLCAYERRIEHIFDYCKEGTLFTSLQQMLIVEKVVRRPVSEGGANIGPPPPL